MQVNVQMNIIFILIRYAIMIAQIIMIWKEKIILLNVNAKINGELLMTKKFNVIIIVMIMNIL